MPTVKVTLDTSQYVQVNNTLNSIVLQSLRDTVRIVLNDTQPTTQNTVYHELGGKDSPLKFESPDTNIWALAMTDRSALIASEMSPAKSAVHDGNGNPLSSYYDATTDKWVLNIHDADVHNVVINKHLHLHSGVSTTLVADTVVGSTYQIQVADTTGFVVGDYLHIDTTSVETTHPRITAITPGAPGTFTLDRRLDRLHLIGDTVEIAIIDMSVNGTMASPVEYWAGPEAGEVFHITRILFEMTHSTAGDLGLFGNLAALTNGVVIRARINGQYGTLTNWKTNANIKTDMFDVVFDTRSSGGGTFGTTGRGTFKEAGAVLRLDAATDDRLELYIQDNLTGLLSFTMKAQGHLEGT